VTIVRIPDGSIGIATDNGIPQLLLPGRHVRTTAAFKFLSSPSLEDEVITVGPIKIFTVKSGGVRVCFNAGKVEIYPEGRYAVNSPTFVVAGHINTTQQCVKFDEHKVLLDGGVSLLVEGLLTYQVVNPALLIKELGTRDLLQSVSQTTKAEIARVFSAIHLEQISSHSGPKKAEKSYLGESHVPSSSSSSSHASSLSSTMSKPSSAITADDFENIEAKEGQTRHILCEDIMKAIKPIVGQWGVRVLNFQLESTVLADEKYAAEYEEASLGLAKAKANRRAMMESNVIMIEQAKARATASRIEAEGNRSACIIEAEGKAEAQRIESKGRNDSAALMTEPFSRTYAMATKQVEFAGALKAKVLTVVPSSAIGGTLLAQSAFTSDLGIITNEGKQER